MFHFILALLGIIFYIILSIIFYPIGLLIQAFNKHAARKYAFFYGKICLSTVGFLAGIKHTTYGKERMIKGEPVLYVSNHRSLQDIIITWNELPSNTCFMAKQSLIDIPVFGWWVLMTGGVGVKRDDHKKAMRSLMTFYDRVDEGESVCIYPEGTRNKNEDPAELLPFKKGACKVAKKCGCIVQPIAVTHTDCFENHFPKLYKEHSTVEFLEPFYFKDLSEEDQKDFEGYCAKRIREAILKNKEN